MISGVFRKYSVTFITLALCSLTVCTATAKTRTITGETTYYDDGHNSRNKIMELAAEQARVEALAREFGTIITQELVQTDRISSGRESNDFLNLSMSEVKGEWLGDIEEPKYDFSLDKDGNMVVVCSVKGNARPISNESVSFETSVLRNGIYAKNADTRFRDGDDMYLYFLGSTDGYLNIWLEDESRKVYGLLPYPGDSKGEVKVKRYQEYTFFNSKSSDDFGPVEELTLTAPDNVEYNRVYVIFSPNRFNRPPMTLEGGIPALSSKDFAKWLMKVRRNDPQLGVKSINIEISPKY